MIPNLKLPNNHDESSNFDGIYVQKKYLQPIKLVIEVYNTYKSQTLEKRRRIKFAAFLVMLILGFIFVTRPFDSRAASDSTVSISNTPISNTKNGAFQSDLLGANLTPWGSYWPDNQYNSMISDMGMGVMRIGHGEKVYVDMETWHGTKGGTPNWNASGVLGAGRTFNDQINWWKTLNMPIVYNLGDEMSCAMTTNPTNCRNQSGAYALDYAEIGRVWSDHIKYLVDQGVNVKYVEIGNEVNIQPMEGIEYPPVAQSSRMSGNGTGCFVDVNDADVGNPACTRITRNTTQTSNNDYIRIWEAVYPLIKQKTPNIKVGMFASGQGPITTQYFPYNTYSTLTSKPEFYAIHQYPFAQDTPAQQVLDATWSVSGKYLVDWEQSPENIHDIKTELNNNGWTNYELLLTEFNYDGGSQYANTNQMWDAMYYASVIANITNYGYTAATFWETFAGSNTDELISDAYSGPVEMRSQALAMRLLKQFKGSRTIISSSVTTSDVGTLYDWQGAQVTLPQAERPKRIESLATRDSSGNYKILLLNKNATTAHSVNLDLSTAGQTNNAVTIKTYSTRNSLDASPPTPLSTNLTTGAVEVALPAMSMAIIDVTAVGGTTYTLTYDGNTNTGGTAPTDNNSPYNSGASVTVLGNTGNLVKTGYTFAGWNTAANGSGTTYTAGNAFTINANSVLYAQWSQAITHTITFDKNDASATGNMILQTFNEGETKALSRNGFALAGSTFAGWATTAGGAVAYVDGANYTMSTGSVTLYAKWTLGGGPITGPIVSFTFDDGNVNVMDYFNIMQQKGFAGTVYVNTEGIVAGDGTRLSVANLNTLKNAGWEISSHTSNHWLDDEQWRINGDPCALVNPAVPETYRCPVERAKTWLDANGFTNSGFASPGGFTSPEVTAIIDDYHPYNRTAWGIQELPIADNYNLAARVIDYATYSEVNTELTNSVVGNAAAWPIYLSHGYGGSELTAFQQIVDRISALNLSVMTVRDVVGGTMPATTYTVTYSGNTNTGGIAPTDANSPYSSGSSVTIAANSGGLTKTGYTFLGWNTAANGTGTNYSPGGSFTINSDVTLYARWAQNTHTLTISRTGNGSGSVASSNPAVAGISGSIYPMAGTLNYGSGTTLTATPSSGSHFDGWSGGGCSGTGACVVSNISSNITVTANFDITTYTVSASTVGTGTVTGTGTVDYGGDATLTANPGTGYHFDGWSGDCSGSTNPYTLSNITANKSCTATFAINTYSLAYNAGSNGSITGSASQTVNYGEAGSVVTAVPDPNYHFVNWTPGNSVTNPRTDSNVIANATYTANFAIDTHNVTFNSNGGSQVTSKTADYGAAITAPPNPSRDHFIFDGWYKDQSLTDDWVFNTDLVIDNTTLYAKWTPNYDITQADTDYTENGVTVRFVGSLPNNATGINIFVTPLVSSAHALPDGKVFVRGYEITAENQDGNSITTGVDAHLSLDYPSANDADEEHYSLLYWNGSEWNSTGLSKLSLNTIINKFAFETNHFSEFALFGEKTVAPPQENPNQTGVLPVTGKNLLLSFIISSFVLLTSFILIKLRRNS